MPPKKRGRPSSTSKPTDVAPTPPAKATKRASTSTSKPTTTPSSRTPPTSTSNHKQPQDPTPQIRAAFDSYTSQSPDGEAIITVPDVSRALRALRFPLPPKDFFDKEQVEEGVGWEEFRELAETLGEGVGDDEGDKHGEDEDENEDDHGDDDEDDDENEQIDDEVKEAFALFTQYHPKGNTAFRERKITLQDLQRIARELKEEVSEETLRLMVEEANGEAGVGGGRKGVGLREFEGVMRRCGAIK